MNRRLTSNKECMPAWLAAFIRPLVISSIVAALAGCSTLAPKYERPAAPVAQAWPQPSRQAGNSAAKLPWQELFADARIRDVIKLALVNNRDLRIAVLNIEKARARYQIQSAAMLPEVNASGQMQAARTPADLAPSGVANVSHPYQLNVGISTYELDLFGRVRSLKDEALQQYLATAEARRATHIALVAEVALGYMVLAGDERLLELSRETLRSRQKAYDLQLAQVQAGTVSPLTLKQAESELEAMKADVLQAENRVANDKNALNLLAGTTIPSNLLPGKQALDGILNVRKLAAGLPSELLQNRPDILAAERQLMAANANIGAARAALFPSISLTTSVGAASNQLNGLFSAGTFAWNLIPRINIPIFDAGRRRSQAEVSEVDQKIAISSYERSIQVAFREVADALAQRSVIDDQLDAQRRRTQAAESAYGLVQQYYASGLSGYLEVLDAQRTLYDAQVSLVRTQLVQNTSLVTLYKALGGGWSTSALDEQST